MPLARGECLAFPHEAGLQQDLFLLKSANWRPPAHCALNALRGRYYIARAQGLALPEPELFPMHQAAAPFVSLLREPHKYPSNSVETFYAWATSIGFTPSKDNLPHIQLGMVRTAGLTFPGCSAKAHSYIQRVAPQVAPQRTGTGYRYGTQSISPMSTSARTTT